MMLRKPWFQILEEVTDGRPRPVPDIVAEVASRRKVSLREMLSNLRHDYLNDARKDALAQIRRERPDLSSTQVAAYFQRDPSSIRHQWRVLEREGAV